MVQASKAEALVAVDFYNTTGERRSLEGFVVHIHLGWLYLLHAEFTRNEIDYRYWERRANGRHCLVRVDGEPKTWELARCARERWPNDNDPVRRNLEFFVGLRNRIEHRHQEAIGHAVAGHAQAMILNYEAELIETFGAAEGLADRLRFPVFLSSLTTTGIEAIKRIRSRMPAKVSRYINEFHEGLASDVVEDQRFEFRIHLVPQIGPKSEADLAVNFVQSRDLEPMLLSSLEHAGKTGLVVKQTKKEPVQNLGKYRPKAVVDRVEESVHGFNMSHHTAAWKRHKVRPVYGADDPAGTDVRYAVWDEPHRDYLYTEAWVAKLIREERAALRNDSDENPAAGKER